jgi:hypothetical protein
VNPLRFLWVSRWTPYRCPRCAQRFARVLGPREQLIRLASALPLFGMALWFQFSRMAVVVLVIGGILVGLLLDWLVLPWRRIETQG